MGSRVGPGEQLHEEVGGVDGDGPQHHDSGLARDAAIRPRLVKPQPPHWPVLATQLLILQPGVNIEPEIRKKNINLFFCL